MALFTAPIEEITMSERRYGIVDGGPATWIAGVKAWMMNEDLDWVRIDSVEAAMKGHSLMTAEEFEKAYPGALATLPADAF